MPKYNTSNASKSDISRKSSFKQKLLVWGKRTLATIITLNLIIWIASPTVAYYFLSDFLEQQYQLSLDEKSTIRFNPFLSHLTIEDLAVTKDGQPVLGITEFNSEIRLHRLAISELYVSEIELKGFSLAIDYKDQELIIAGVSLSQFDAESPESDVSTVQKNPDKSDFSIVIPSLSFLDHTFGIIINGDQHAVIIQDYKMHDMVISDEFQVMTSTLEMTIDAAPLKISTQIDMRRNLGTIKNQLSLSQFDLARLKKQLPSEVEKLLGKLDFSLDSKIEIKEQGIQISLPRTSITVSEFSLSQINLEVAEKLQRLEFVNTKINLSDAANEVTIGVESSLLQGESFSVKLPELELTNAEREISIKDIKLSIDQAGNIESQLASIVVSLGDISGSNQVLIFDTLKSELKINKVVFTKNGELSKFSFNAGLEINKIASYVGERSNLLSRIDALSISNMVIDKDQSLVFGFDSISISDSEFSNKLEQPEVPEVVSFDSLNFTNFQLVKNVIELDKISVSGLNANLNIGPKKGIKNLVPYELLLVEKELVEKELTAIEFSESLNKNLEQPNDESIVQAPLVKLNRFELIDSKVIAFIDESVKPIYKRQFFIEELFVENIDATNPNGESPFKIQGKSDRYTKFDFEGYLKPFTKELNLKLKGKLSEVSLPHTSSYIKNVLGFKFESGELDTELDIVVINSEIQGNADIDIRGLNLAATDEYDQTTLEQQTALPLNVALGMLQDSEGNVELDIPMTGNVNSPTFGFGSFIGLVTKKAIQSAAQSYLIKTFVPYAEIVTMTISAGEFILKTRFEDLNYSAENVTLAEDQMIYVNQFIALMKDKSSTQVKICAISTAQDIKVIESPPLDDEALRAFLTEQSTKRMNYFKEYVVKEGIPSARVLICIPKVELNDEKPSRIEISV